jgi:acetate kinase
MGDLILALNAGSSTLKAGLFDLAEGGVRRLASRTEATQGHPSMGPAVRALLDWARTERPGDAVTSVGHRVVHGGSRFQGPERITPEALQAIEALCPLAPLHQPQAVAAIRAVAEALPQAAQVACFDTAFHRTQPEIAGWIALTRALHDKGVRRYGFHGLSYAYLARRVAELDPALSRGRLILAHLGSGASLCALAGGRSLDATMGFSPLDGLVMGTRPGAIDPGAVLYLMQHERRSADEIEDLLYHRSGLLGVSGESGDMQALLASPGAQAREAVELFVYRAAREAGGLVSVLGGLDGIVFAGGIGEHSAEIRARICARLAWLGVAIDAEANARVREGRISADGSRVRAWVVPTDEERVIAVEAAAVLGLA